MQCKFCGQQLPENAICCSRCGGSMTSSKEMHIPKPRDEEMMFNIKPAFDLATLGVRAFFLAVFIGAVAMVTIGSIFTVVLSLLGSMNSFAAFWITGVAFFYYNLLVIYVYCKEKIQWQESFTFYQSRMEYTYTHLTANSDTLNIRQSLIQVLQKDRFKGCQTLEIYPLCVLEVFMITLL